MLGFSPLSAAPLGGLAVATSTEPTDLPPGGEIDATKVPTARVITFSGGIRTVAFAGGIRTVRF